jgi:hypothetical protein
MRQNTMVKQILINRLILAKVPIEAIESLVASGNLKGIILIQQDVSGQLSLVELPDGVFVECLTCKVKDLTFLIDKCVAEDWGLLK